MARQNVSNDTKWEAVIGYSRAVRVGPSVQVAGTTAIGPNGEIVGKGDVYQQAKYALEKVVTALAEAGARPEHVVRTRIYLTDVMKWEEAGRAHREVFGEIRPANTILQVAALVQPDMLVEIEAEAFIA